MRKISFTSTVLSTVLILILILAVPGQCHSSAVQLDSTKGWSDLSGKVLNGVIGTWDAQQKAATLTTNLKRSIHILSDEIKLEGNGHEIVGCKDTPKECERKIGIKISGKTNIELSNLTITNFVTGLSIENCTRIVATRIYLADNKFGLKIDDSKETEIRDSTLANNNTGATITNSNDGNLLSNNIISGNQHHGLKAIRSSRNNIVGNTFEKNGLAGIVFTNSCFNNSCNGNSFLYNGRYGILINNNAKMNYFFRNNFIGNRFKHVWSIRSNHFFQPPPIGGNYWGKGERERYPRSWSPNITSAWSTPDLDKNGFVDRPYPIFSTYSSKIAELDEFPWTSKNGWLKTDNTPVNQK